MVLRAGSWAQSGAIKQRTSTASGHVGLLLLPWGGRPPPPAASSCGNFSLTLESQLRYLGILRTQHVAGHQHTERCVFPWTSIAPSLCPTPARCRFAAGLDITSDTSEVKVKVVRGESAVGPSCPLAGRWLAALLCCGLLSLLVLFGSSDFCLNSMRWAFLLDINFFLNN